jgi:hypothetical protein
MKNVYILHGCCDREEFADTSIPSGSNFHWIPWLQKQLIVRGYNCQTPEMPAPYAPDYHVWKGLFDIYPVDENTVLAGHSCGGGFLLRYLSENPKIMDKLVLVAPWLDPGRTRGDFLECKLDPALSERVREMHVFYSEDEPVDGVKETVDMVMDTYPSARLHKFTDHGHFCLDDMGTEKFPELLNVIAPP